LALGWYVVIATGARGTAVGIAGALFVTAILLPNIRKALVWWQFPGLFAALAIYGLVVASHQKLENHPISDIQELHQLPSLEATPVRPESNAAAIQQIGDSTGQFTEPLTGGRMWTSSGRIAMWRETLDDAEAQPLLGIGPMNYACSGPIDRAGHPHNFPLQVMVEWGIPALLLLLSAAGALFYRLACALRNPATGFERDARLAGFFASGILAAMILACLDGVMTMPASQVTGVLVCGVLLGLLPGTRVKIQSSITASALLTSALIVSIAFLAFARQELSVADARWEQTPLLDRGIPRFWQNGKVCRLYQEQGESEINR
jgi:O-antigen ligase